MFHKGLVIACIIALIDQWSKYAAFKWLDEIGHFVEVTSFFNIVKVWNTGISFGIFNDLTYGAYILTGFAIIIMIILGVWLYKTDRPIVAYGIGLVEGGALGNVIDRIRFEAVADFLDFHIAGYHWPAFNVADAAIFIGVALLFIDSIFEDKINDKAKP